MIKKISIDDLNAFNALGLLINDKFCDLFNLNDLLKSEYDYLFGFYFDNKLIGFIHLNKLYENMDIVNIVVDFNHRCKGIATSLINYSIEYFNDLKNVFLEVNENNINAIELYKKCNFKIINIRKMYYGKDDAIIMKRDV